MGKSLQERIKELDDYRPDISYKDGAFILKIKFKSGWNVIQPDNDRVAYAKDNKVQGLHWYVSSIEDTDMIFDIIEETIVVNKEMEKKLLLYKEKVKDLEELFLSDVPYEKLVLLQFTFPDDNKKKAKRSSQKKNDTAVQSNTETDKNVYVDSVTGKEYDNTPITGSKPVDGTITASETVSETYSDIDRKIAEAIGE